jgi:hypothetical protein
VHNWASIKGEMLCVGIMFQVAISDGLHFVDTSSYSSSNKTKSQFGNIQISYGYHGIQNNLRSSLGIFIDDAQNVKEWVTIHAQ